MDSPFKEEIEWEPVEAEATRSESPFRNDRRHPSSASISTLSTADGSDQPGGRGRRSRPSVASASSLLPTVREKKEQRALSVNTPPSLTHVTSQETVVSSKKVSHAR